MTKKNYNTKFDEIMIPFSDQNGRPLEIEDKVDLTLLINKLEMTQYSIEPITRKYVKGYEFLLFARKYKKQLLDTGLDSLKTACKKVIHQAAEATGEFIGNKIAYKIVKPNHVIDKNPRNIEEIIISLGKREEILNKLRQLL